MSYSNWNFLMQCIYGNIKPSSDAVSYSYVWTAWRRVRTSAESSLKHLLCPSVPLWKLRWIFMKFNFDNLRFAVVLFQFLWQLDAIRGYRIKTCTLCLLSVLSCWILNRAKRCLNWPSTAERNTPLAPRKIFLQVLTCVCVHWFPVS
jgi:hypothetical protein